MAGVSTAYWAEARGNPLLAGTDQTASALAPVVPKVPPKGAKVDRGERLTLDDGGHLDFVDQRTFGHQQALRHLDPLGKRWCEPFGLPIVPPTEAQ